jgi:hypothetical protein
VYLQINKISIIVKNLLKEILFILKEATLSKPMVKILILNVMLFKLKLAMKLEMLIAILNIMEYL